MGRLRRLRDKADHRLLAYRTATSRLKQEQQALVKAEDQVKDVLEAQHLAQHVAQKVQQEAHSQIAGVVTKCLRAVCGERAYNFKINFRRQRGRTDAMLLFERDGLEVEPLDSASGGFIDIAAFALRLSCLLLQPQLRKLLILDEPFRFLSPGLRHLVPEFLQEVSEATGVQLLVVTNEEQFKAGTVVRVGQPK